MSTIEVEHEDVQRTPDAAVMRSPHAELGPSRQRRGLLLLWFSLAAAAILIFAPFLTRDTLTELLGGATPQTRPERGVADSPTHPSNELAIVLDILFKDEGPGSDAAHPEKPAQRIERDRSPHSLDLNDPERARVVQQRLAALGYLQGDVNGKWDPASRQALREFKAAHQLPVNEDWDQVTERALVDSAAQENASFVGLWAPEPAACSPRNRTPFLPALINHQGAMAGEVSCNFANGQRIGSTWSFAASCSSGRRRWSANVKIAVSGDVMTWTSERGSQRYVRCAAR